MITTAILAFILSSVLTIKSIPYVDQGNNANLLWFWVILGCPFFTGLASSLFLMFVDALAGAVLPIDELIAFAFWGCAISAALNLVVYPLSLFIKKRRG